MRLCPEAELPFLVNPSGQTIMYMYRTAIDFILNRNIKIINKATFELVRFLQVAASTAWMEYINGW